MAIVYLPHGLPMTQLFAIFKPVTIHRSMSFFPLMYTVDLYNLEPADTCSLNQKQYWM